MFQRNAQPRTLRYSDEYYKLHQEESFRSAEHVVPIVLQAINPRSVVDVGCGVGTWLSVFQKNGIHDFLGIDGEHVSASLLQIPRNKFLPMDLEEDISLERTFDLAISLEVAEHLNPVVAAQFIKALTMLAPAVLFSAAIPFQMGTNHINEQWQSYWADIFSTFDYRPTTVVREKIWTNKDVKVWYKQNTILYIKNEMLTSKKYAILPHEVIHASSTSVVHPEQFLEAADPKIVVGSRLLLLFRALPRIFFTAMRKGLTFLWP